MSEQQVITATEVAEAKARRISLIEKFAHRYGVEPNKMMRTLRLTAFRVKDGEVTDEQMMALLIVADQHGLNPWTKEIYAYPDKKGGIVPVVGVDGWARIINEHPQFDGMEFAESPTLITPEGGKPCPEWIECTMYRKDREHPVRIREYLDEVYRPAFKTRDGADIAGPWQTHTKRMHRHKTMIQCARIAFSFAGIYDPDEAERVLAGENAIEAEPFIRGGVADHYDHQDPHAYTMISAKKLRVIIGGMLKAVAAKDGVGLLQILDELDNDEKLYVFGRLRSWEKRAVADLETEARAADAGIGLIGWSMELLNSCKDGVALEAAYKAIGAAYDTNGGEVPKEVQERYEAFQKLQSEHLMPGGTE
jgi:phage recombination protein Bet